jgi:hypothetical protein
MDNIEKSISADSVATSVALGGATQHSGAAKGHYEVQCFDADGNLKWTEGFDNLVVNGGLQAMNTDFFTGSSYSATWYLGLITGPGASNTYAATDTMASHAGWTENAGYTQTSRVTCSFGTATTANPSVISNSGSPAVFSMNASATIGGAFLTSNNTKSGTTGVLFSAASFASPGDRSVVSGDTLTVTYTFSLTGS